MTMPMDDSEYRIVDDGPKINEINGRGFKVVVKTVNTIQNDCDVDPERDVTKFFKDRDGKCVICELRCDKDDCTDCNVPKYSEKITTIVIEKITTHKLQLSGINGGIKIQKSN